MNSRNRVAKVLSLSIFGAWVFAQGAWAAQPPPPPPPPEGGAPPPPPGEVPPPPPEGEAPATDAAAGGLVADAEKNYEDEKYEAAGVQLQKIASGEIPSSAEDQQRAQFVLGKALFKLGFFSASLAVFDEIVQAGDKHPYHALTLPWLASISRELPEGAGVLERIGTYPPTALENESFDEVRDELYYLLGRFYYHKGDLGQATSLLAQVPQDSDYYIPAQFFLGVSHTREFKAEPAVDSFKNVLRRSIELREAAEADKSGSRKRAKLARKAQRKAKKGEAVKVSAQQTFEDEMRRYEHLAAMGLANIFYAIGKFETALKYLDKLPLESPYWLDSVFWASWSEFRSSEVDYENANAHYQRTLGHVHTLNAPFFEEYLFPDAIKLKAVTYYFNCRYDSAKRTVDEFNRRYPATKKQLESLLDKAPEDFQLYDLAAKIRKEDSKLDPFVEQLARVSMSDKKMELHFAYVAELERELEVLEDKPSSFRSEGVGERVSEDLDLALSAAKESAGAQARQRLLAAIKDIKDLEREMIKIEYEILEKRKQQGAVESVPPKPQRPKIDSEHEIYNYNGEYWQDELGYYRYKVTSLCKEST